VTGALKKLDMVVSINVYLDESTDFADYVLPEPSYLERYNLSNFSFDQQGLQIAQPVVAPMGDTKEGMDILIELAHRAEFLFSEDGFNAQLNRTLGLKPPYALDLHAKYSYLEILNQQALCHSAGKQDLDWYMRNGNSFKPLKPHQKYCYYQDARMPLFFNHVKFTGDELKENLKRFKVNERHGISVNLSQYEGFPHWEFSPIHEDREYDLFLIAYKSYLTTYVDMATNPLIMDIVESDPYHLRVMINTKTAREKGLLDGDRIWIESCLQKRPARVKLSEGIHPATLAVSQGFGRKGRHAVARDRGVEYNPHLPISLAYSGMLGGSMESAAKVRIFKRSEGEKTCDTE
jgi:anaerobic selenocysteine-containing dehydrogenase